MFFIAISVLYSSAVFSQNDFEARLTGTPGFIASAEWVAGKIMEDVAKMIYIALTNMANDTALTF